LKRYRSFCFIEFLVKVVVAKASSRHSLGLYILIVAFSLIGGTLNEAVAQSQSGTTSLSDTDKEALRNGMAALDRNDIAEAIRLFRPLADRGVLPALGLLGATYLGAHDAPHAVTWLRKAADQGSAVAQSSLASIYEFGADGVPKDEAQAIALYRKAASQGHPDAETDLGKRYLTGQGVPQDTQQAFTFLSEAADKGNPDAEGSLATIYLGGHGMPVDDAKAVYWLRKAVDQGNDAAEGLLGSLYLNGFAGLPKDYSQAKILLTKSAQQGDADAQFALGLMYYSGAGAKADHSEARKWFQMAATQGHEKAKGYVADIDNEKRQSADAVPPSLQFKCMLQAFDPKVAGGGGNTNGVEGLARTVNDPRYKACIEDFYKKYHLNGH
jgi:TPR repeat protein